MLFWTNPEFIRHVRAELRPARALSTGLVVLIICFLVGLSCWGAEHEKPREFYRVFYGWLLGLQFGVIGLWGAFACGPAVSRERDLKTFDFQRTTRLTAGELMAGKVLGAPVLGWFALACSLPVSLVAGLTGGFSFAVLLQAYALLVAFILFLSTFGLWMSMMMERANSGAAGLLALLPMGSMNRPARTS